MVPDHRLRPVRLRRPVRLDRRHPPVRPLVLIPALEATPIETALEATRMPENDDAGQSDTGQQAPEATQSTDTATQPDAPEATDGQADEVDPKLDPKVKDKIERINREASALRKRIKELEPAARKLKALEDKDKTESQRLQDQLAELQAEITEYKVREVRTAAAAAAGLPATMAQFITASDPEEATAQAKALLEWRKPDGPADLKQGARQPTAAQATGDQLIRRMAGRQQ